MIDVSLSRRGDSPRPPWWKRETPVPNWALVCFFVLTVNGIVELISRAF